MKFPAERPEFFDQRFFDEVVDVFGAGAEFFQPRSIRPGRSEILSSAASVCSTSAAVKMPMGSKA